MVYKGWRQSSEVEQKGKPNIQIVSKVGLLLHCKNNHPLEGNNVSSEFLWCQNKEQIKFEIKIIDENIYYSRDDAATNIFNFMTLTNCFILTHTSFDDVALLNG